MDEYLASSEVIDWQHPAIIATARMLRRESFDATAKATFEWVRDEIKHSWDFQLNPVTCAASEALTAQTGYCFAKSHLLVALLRANDIHAGLCYQRLVVDDDGQRLSLHGLAAIYHPEHAWYRLDPRGNKPGIDAQFCPPVEQLAWKIQHAGEMDMPGVYPEPLPEVVHALRSAKTWDAFHEIIPDVNLH